MSYPCDSLSAPPALATRCKMQVGVCIACVALVLVGAGSSPMLSFAKPGRYDVALNRHGHGWASLCKGAPSRQQRQQRAPLYALPWEALPWQQQRQQQRQWQLAPTMGCGSNAVVARNSHGRRMGSSTAMSAKGVDTTASAADTRSSEESNQPSLPQLNASAPTTTTKTSVEIMEGTRVRLRDTGRLGIVVGKKAGGWWIVDLLERLGGGRSNKAAASSPAGTRGKATAASAAAKGMAGRGGASRNASAVDSGGSISTRKVNLEPLGDAYASSEESPVAVDVPGAGVKQRRSPTSTNSGTSAAAKVPESVPQKGRGSPSVIGVEAGSTKAVGGETRSAATAAAIASLPLPLAGQTISVDVPGAAVGGGTVPITAMSAEGMAHADMKEWLVFSDLHVSPGSLAVSLEALDRVNVEAMKRPACGIAFLGDFWHVRGSIKVDLLVPVMKRFSTWTRPVVMIPGNHDQVTLGGRVHALTPLQFAFADPKQALVLSEPTLFLGALWIPHRRNNAAMETLLASKEARSSRAIFCHVDIKGAAMNDGVSSRSGIPRSAFPDGVPAFSGHFHKPHTVGDGFIRYVGSPYQTSLAESGQSKALIVLDAATWKEKETIPLDIGRRYFRVKGDDQPLPEAGEASPGDRVVWTVKDAGSEDVRRRAEALQKEMVEVEIREAPKPFPFVLPEIFGAGGGGEDAKANGTASAGAGFADSASLLPDVLFRTYLERERTGGRNVSEKVERLGFNLISDFGEQTPFKENGREDRLTSLVLHSIQLKNFGPFRDEMTYPLDDRGLVLLRGSNLDDSGADSNGAGKTTLAMSALWALAGVVDARPVSDGRVADVVHEGTRALPSVSKPSSNGGDAGGVSGGAGEARRATVAEATLTGTLNGKPLWLKRRKGTRVNQLFLEHDGKDLTRQIAKETQVVLEEELGLSPHVLMRGIFQGQHHVNGLLESTDAQLKEELALLVPMGMWQELASRSRAMARKSDEDAARFRERAVTRREDLDRLTQELERVREDVASRIGDRSRHRAAINNGTVLSGPPQGPGTSTQNKSTIVESETLSPPSEKALVSDAAKRRKITTDVSPSKQALKGSPEVGDGGEEGEGALVAALAEAGRASRQARRVARQAREDAEAAEEALRVLRMELGELVEGWTDRRMTLLGETKAAHERVSFLRRDVDQAELRLRDSQRAASDMEDESVLLRERDRDLWDTLARSTADGKVDAQASPAVAGDVESVEALSASSRLALADAEAAFRQASEAVRAHAGLELVGEGACHTCGQTVTGSIIHERGEILQVSQTVAAAELRRAESEAAVSEQTLLRARARADLWGEMARASRDGLAARERVGECDAELQARRAELRRENNEESAAEEGVEELARREGLLRREWAAKTKAAEWALKAHRDKQIFAQHELEAAVACESEIQLQSQAQQAEQQRLLQAEEVALARVREIEVAVARVRGELAEVTEKEREASEMKATCTALAEHLGVRGVQNFVFRDVVNQLQANVARYLDALSDGALALRLSMDGDRVVKRASARAADGGFRDRSLSQLSGGQWRRASLALELAFAELARQRSRFSCNLLVLDEVLSQLDAYGRARVANMLRALAHGRAADDEFEIGATQAMYSTILVVLQDLPAEELQESFDRIDQVVKHRDSSSVVVDGDP